MNVSKSKERSYSRTRASVFLVFILFFPVIVITVVGIISMIHGDVERTIETSNAIGAALVVAIPTVALVWVAYFQLGKNREFQRAAFLGEYVSKISTHGELSDAL